MGWCVGMVIYVFFDKDNPLRSIRVNSFSWHYFTSGKGDKTIVFLHGMGGGYDIWWQQINHFKINHRVICMTYPPIPTLAGLSAGIISILDREQVGKMIIVGSSLGGYFAQFLVKHYPDRVEKVVFANTFPPNKIIIEKTGKAAKILPLLPEWIVMRNFRRTIVESIYPASGYSELVRAYLMEQSYGMMRKNQFLARLNCVLEHFIPPDMEALKIPALIIEVDNDPLVDENLRELLKSSYPSIPVKTFHQKGHFPYLNAPDEYNRTLEQFLSNS